MKEIWKPVPKRGGFYDVSSMGRVRSWRSAGLSRGRRRRAIIMTPQINANGYRRVLLSKGSARTPWLIGRLVLTVFVGKCPSGHQCAHLDGDPSNNRVGNLVWATPKENAAHREAHGNTYRGEDHPGAKLTGDQVRRIRDLRVSGAGVVPLGRLFGVLPSTISRICGGVNWGHLK